MGMSQNCVGLYRVTWSYVYKKQRNLGFIMFWGPHSKGSGILGSILGVPLLRENHHLGFKRCIGYR